MRKRDVSFTIALCASLVVHAGISLTMSESYVREFGRIWLPGFGRASLAEVDVPQMAMFRPEDDPRFRLGESDATGTAIDSSAGDQPMLAPQGLQDQPFLSRDPIGPGKIGDPPTESTALPGDGQPRT